jgi:hypothetical protein
MNEIQLRDGLFELFPPDHGSDWDDVLRRAARPRRHLSRLSLLVAAALLVLLAIGSALALSGQLGGLFHGTPVNDLTPNEKFMLSEWDMNGKVQLVAKRGSTAFYVIRGKDGRLCYSVGVVRSHLTPAQREANIRFGSTSCFDRRVFPSRAVPVLDFSFYSFRRGDREARLGRLSGFAADPVARIGVIGRDNRIVFSVPVEHNVYTSGSKGVGVAGARGIAALDKHEKVLWVQCTARSGRCGRYKNSRPPRLPPLPQAARKSLVVPLVRQSAEHDGVTLLVRGRTVRADLTGLSPTTQRLLEGKRSQVIFTCFKLVKFAGKEFSRGVGLPRDYEHVITARFGESLPGKTFSAPFDGCTITGQYGHTWNDSHGTHDAVEVPLTPRGRRYFAERAVTRDIEWLARARIFYDIRYGVVTVDAASAAKHLGPHVVALAATTATPPVGKLGIWMGPKRRIVLVERAPTGRRFFLELRRGIMYRTNLGGF